MELTLEAYRNILKHVGSRADVAALCRVSKGFRHVAERALYNTLFLGSDNEAVLLCHTLANSMRLSALVDALTISLLEEVESSDSEGEVYDDEPTELPDMYWTSVSQALQQTVHLRYLNIHINNGSTTSTAWILDKSVFQLRKFHCDFDWDQNLVNFLDRQTDLQDLYILDYKSHEDSDTPTTSSAPSPRSMILRDHSIPNLSTLECTFPEAAVAIVPGRPITHLKTCFSRSKLDEKRVEMDQLLSNVRLSTRPLQSLDIADSSYTEEFSMVLLAAISIKRSLMSELYYLGTLVLPIDGRERLQFYGLMMRFPKIRTIELEVTEWYPPPSSPAAFRALANEMRLYNPSITRVVFVHDFDRSVVVAVNGVCRIDTEISTDLLWRER
ncbi:hypothetical protein B0H34DRAFT_668974 [Crassisporium funariophilum]|nr:hypothetical protein B0H34DRAFT_668974 [Crassisporium funariophilum]